MSLVAAVLTPQQQDVIEHYQAYNVPASWFIGVPQADGEVEVIVLGEGFAWSFLISADGNHASSEARLSDFETGVTI